ncbi:MAG: DUF1501 domain-containing protein [Planctomycetaceae bacterium]|nr:DUF1501 domain-containing protein [Planctomycetaceae bacterium]
MLRLVMDDGPLQRSINRREILRISGLAGLISPFAAIGGTTSDATRLPGFGRAKSVIVVYANGGQSQLETWDPKPHAPREIRGEFAAIPTAIPGYFCCEHLPRIAQIADRLCVIRSMSHEDLDHGSAFYLSMTGRYHRRRSGNPLPSPDDFPCVSSVLQSIRPGSALGQAAVHLNGPAVVPLIEAPGQFGGFLGKGYDPLTIGDVTASHIPIPALEPMVDLAVPRLRRRESLRKQLEQAAHQLESVPPTIDQETLYRNAFELLTREETRAAFELHQEPDTVRDRYGRNRSGQACLLARRLAQAGVPLITVIWNHNNRGQDLDANDPDLYGWDTHNDIFSGLKNHLLPRFDQSFSALIEDLDQRGMLESTLVICLGEFGRAPLVAVEKNFAGAAPGRKHWSWVYSIAMAGAGIARGSIVGESDERGAYPRTEQFGPWDTVATIFSALGIDPHQVYRDPLDRPVRICEGNVITAAYQG